MADAGEAGLPVDVLFGPLGRNGRRFALSAAVGAAEAGPFLGGSREAASKQKNGKRIEGDATHNNLPQGAGRERRAGEFNASMVADEQGNRNLLLAFYLRAKEYCILKLVSRH